MLLAKISQLMHLTISAKLHILMKTREAALENFIGSRKSLKNIAS